MMKTWHYFAIGGGLILAYLVLSPKSSLLKTKPASSTANLGGTLTGGGNLLDGFANAWRAITGKDSDDETDENAE
jgi:hypothetical protein